MHKSLTKATEEVVRTLTKRGVVSIPRDINVSLLLDISGSMRPYFSNGSVTGVLERLLSISNTIDDDGVMPLTLFHHDAHFYREVKSEEYENAQSIIDDIVSRYSFGGTEFTPAVVKALETLAPSVGFFSRLFSKPAVPAVEGKQLLVLITDGENSDSREFSAIVQELEKMPNIYLQTIAVGFDSGYLSGIADQSDSVGYTSISSFTGSDEKLINSIISNELLTKFSNI